MNAYVPLQTGKEMWNALDDCSVVEQAHEIQTLAKELENFGTVLPDKFVAGRIIAKLPQA